MSISKCGADSRSAASGQTGEQAQATRGERRGGFRTSALSATDVPTLTLTFKKIIIINGSRPRNPSLRATTRTMSLATVTKTMLLPRNESQPRRHASPRPSRRRAANRRRQHRRVRQAAKPNRACSSSASTSITACRGWSSAFYARAQNPNRPAAARSTSTSATAATPTTTGRRSLSPKVT